MDKSLAHFFLNYFVTPWVSEAKNMLQFLLIYFHGRVPYNGVSNYR